MMQLTRVGQRISNLCVFWTDDIREPVDLLKR